VKYADDLLLLAKEETVLQGMFHRLIEIGRGYGMEMNVDKAKVMRISMQPSPIKIIIDQKHLESVEYFNYLCSMITNYARRTREMKSRIAMAKAASESGEYFRSALYSDFTQRGMAVFYLSFGTTYRSLEDGTDR
jgi:hypothetical protein